MHSRILRDPGDFLKAGDLRFSHFFQEVLDWFLWVFGECSDSKMTWMTQFACANWTESGQIWRSGGWGKKNNARKAIWEKKMMEARYRTQEWCIDPIFFWGGSKPTESKSLRNWEFLWMNCTFLSAQSHYSFFLDAKRGLRRPSPSWLMT